ncbi:MAG: serine/threonine protein kinase [Rhodocyclales bacterium]|nr:serine/threonine protein kinase [Rhodocyclales bacterium]
MPIRRRAILLSLLVLGCTAIAWWLVHVQLAERLGAVARRDLDTILEFVSLDLIGAAEDAPARKGFALLDQVSRPDSGLARTLARVDDENFRRIYFFDGAGRVSAASGGALTSPAIVRAALADGAASPADRRGVLLEPYADDEGQDVVGVWHWSGALQLGIVAERSYDRYIQPVRWVDAIFFTLTLLGTLSLSFLAQVDLRKLRDAFRRSDIDSCGPYSIKGLIGEGTMANVYRAEHRHLKRVVALKRLKIQSQRDETLERFDREARLASQLSHPNIITVLDHGRAQDGSFYYTMEFIRGLTLTQWVEQHGPLPPARAVRMLRQICAAVGAMHARQLLHRDIKPDNVIAYAAHGNCDLVKLLDFGLIRDLENKASRDLTRNARVLGTPAFMAPERLRDPRCVDPRTDLYGIGCIAYYLLTGRRPFEATIDADLVQQVQHIEAPRASASSVFAIPPALDDLIASALAKDMDDRPASAEAFDAALRAIEPAVPWHLEQARLWWQSILPDAEA